MAINEHDRRKIDAGKEEIMTAVQLLLEQHKNSCAVSVMQDQHERMYKEMFNGDDGKSGFFAEMRTFVTAWKTRTSEDDNRKKRRWVAAAVVVPVLCLVLAEPAQVGWQKVCALSDLAGKASDIIKLTDDWKRYYENPPVHPMDPPPTVTPPSAQPRKKQQKSFFEYSHGGVGLMKEHDLPQDVFNHPHN